MWKKYFSIIIILVMGISTCAFAEKDFFNLAIQYDERIDSERDIILSLKLDKDSDKYRNLAYAFNLLVKGYADAGLGEFDPDTLLSWGSNDYTRDESEERLQGLFDKYIELFKREDTMINNDLVEATNFYLSTSIFLEYYDYMIYLESQGIDLSNTEVISIFGELKDRVEELQKVINELDPSIRKRISDRISTDSSLKNQGTLTDKFMDIFIGTSLLEPNAQSLEYLLTSGVVEDQAIKGSILNENKYMPLSVILSDNPDKVLKKGLPIKTRLATVGDLYNSVIDGTERVFILIEESQTRQEEEDATRNINSGEEDEVIEFKTELSVDSSIWEGSHSEPILVTGKTKRFLNSNENMKSNMQQMILFNIFNYFKKLDEVDKSNVLLIDLYGNIVIYDGTVILPSYVNPRYYKDPKDYKVLSKAFINSYPTVTGDSNQASLLDNIRGSRYVLNGAVMNGVVKGDPILASTLLKGTIGKFVNTVVSGVSMGNVDVMCDALAPDFGDSTDDRYSLFNTSRGKALMYSPLRVEVDGGRSQVLSSVGKNNEELLYQVNRRYFYENTKSGGVALKIDKAGIDQAFLINNILNIVELYGEDDRAIINKNFKASYVIPVSALNGAVNRLGGLIEEFLDGNLMGFNEVLGTNYIDRMRIPKLLESNRKILYVALIFIILFTGFEYAIGRIRFTSIPIISIMSMFIILFTLTVGPSLLSTVQEKIASTISHQTAWDVLLLESEEDYKHYTRKFETYMDLDNKTSMSNLALTMYKFNNRDMNSVISQYIQNGGDISSIYNFYFTNKVRLPNSYMYIEGDELKLRISDLFNNETISGDYVNLGKDVYKLDYNRLSPNNIDYYMPYSMILENLVYKMNTYSSIINPTRRQHRYSSDILKDSFIFNSYFSSVMFWDYEDDTTESVREAVEKKISSFFEDPRGEDKDEVDREVAVILEPYIKNKEELKPEDFLGLKNILEGRDLGDPEDLYLEGIQYSNPALREMIKFSNWYNVARTNKIVDWLENSQATPEDRLRYEQFVQEVNINTLDFIFRIHDQIPYISDENLLKITALYATTQFNEGISTLTNTANPVSLTQGDVNINQFLKVSFIDIEDRYTREFIDLTYYVAMKGSVLLMPLFGIAVFLLWLSLLVLNNVLLFSTVGFVFFYMLNILKKDGKVIEQLLSAYLTILVKYFVIYFLYQEFLNILGNDTNLYGLHVNVYIRVLGTILVSVFILKSLYFTLKAILKNPTTLGHGNLISSKEVVFSVVQKVMNLDIKKERSGAGKLDNTALMEYEREGEEDWT